MQESEVIEILLAMSLNYPGTLFIQSTECLILFFFYPEFPCGRTACRLQFNPSYNWMVSSTLCSLFFFDTFAHLSGWGLLVSLPRQSVQWWWLLFITSLMPELERPLPGSLG